MKKLLLILIIFSGCSKDKNSPDDISVSGSVSYKVNGTLVTIDNAHIMNGEGVLFAKQLKGSVLSNTRYLLNAQKGIDNVLIFTITTDSLREQEYRIDSVLVNKNPIQNIGNLMFNGQLAYIFFSGDKFEVEITSYSNNRISGIFSGTFTPVTGGLPDFNNRSTISITDGKLNNIPVTY